MSDMYETIKNRRTIRRYKNEQIKEDELRKILEAGICAPSAGGAQRGIVTAVQNRKITDKLGRINVSVMKRPKVGSVSADQPSIIDDPTIKSGFYQAPTVCVVFNKESSGYSIADSFCMAENMILQAADLGVSSAVIGRAEMTFDNEYGRQLMKEWNIPEDYTARCFVLLGYLDGPYPAAKPRREGRIRIIGE